MDKSQKQLVDTYFRKRAIASKQNNTYRLLSHEKRFLFDNKNMSLPYVDIDLDFDDLLYFISKDPKYYDEFKNHNVYNKQLDQKKDIVVIRQPVLLDKFDTNTFTDDQVWHILQHHPELIDRFEERIDTLSGNFISAILSNQPKLYPHLKKYIYKIDNQSQRDLLLFQPQFFPLFADDIPKWNRDQTGLLFNYPEKINDYDWNIDLFSDYDIYRFIEKYPDTVNEPKLKIELKMH